MFKVKVYGAGSIGNHLANASRTMGWDVTICDIDPAAIIRTKKEIYPARYGQWDENIKLYEVKDIPADEYYDFVVVGTPPDSHLKIALSELKKENPPKIILVEKPFSTPDLEGNQELYSLAKEKGVHIFVGYDHSVSASARKVQELLKEKKLGIPDTIDVEFREYWGGIFKAHPWLDGPQDTYLGFWNRGGGSLGEHSHALHMWIYLAKISGFGAPKYINANMDFVNDGIVNYDKVALLNIETDQGSVGRVVQDVVTSPTRKWAHLQWNGKRIEWHANYKAGKDAVFYYNGEDKEEFFFPKTRPDDFIEELKHIEKVCNGEPVESPISVEMGLLTMNVISAGYKSYQNKTHYEVKSNDFTLASITKRS